MRPNHCDEQARLRAMLRAKRIDIADPIVVLGDGAGLSMGDAYIDIEETPFKISIPALESVVDRSQTTDNVIALIRTEAIEQPA